MSNDLDEEEVGLQVNTSYNDMKYFVSPKQNQTTHIYHYFIEFYTEPDHLPHPTIIFGKLAYI